MEEAIKWKRNRKFLRATSELPNATLENTKEETLKTMKYEIENKSVTPSRYPKGLTH